MPSLTALLPYTAWQMLGNKAPILGVLKEEVWFLGILIDISKDIL
jgi:hypothetical protein